MALILLQRDRWRPINGPLQITPSADNRRSPMMDAMMIGFGTAMFLGFLGYIALCEGL
jgi:hypothetical protein